MGITQHINSQTLRDLVRAGIVEQKKTLNGKKWSLTNRFLQHYNQSVDELTSQFSDKDLYSTALAHAVVKTSGNRGIEESKLVRFVRAAFVLMVPIMLETLTTQGYVVRTTDGNYRPPSD